MNDSNSLFQFEFVDGSVVILESCASGRTLRSLHGKAEGFGGRGAHGTIYTTLTMAIMYVFILGVLVPYIVEFA